MSTQSVSSYNSGYDPYLAQRINQAVNAAKAGSVSDSTFTGQTSQSTPKVSQEDLEEYRKQIAEVEKLQNQSQKGMVIDNGGQKLQVQSDGYIATDGCNDGKISFGSKLKNIGKGIVKTFTGMFTDKNGKFSLKQTLKSVAIAGACIAVSACSFGAGAALLYAGLAIGGIGLVKNGVKAAKAKTDQEAEQAWQGIGTSGTVVAMSLAGLKNKGAAINQANGVTKEAGIKGAIKGLFSDLKVGFKTNNQEIASAASKVLHGGYMSEVRSNVATKIFDVKDWNSLKDLSGKEKLSAAYNNFKGKVFEGITEKSQIKDKSIDLIDKDIEALSQAKTKVGLSAEEIADIDAQLDRLTIQRDMYSQIDNVSAHKVQVETEAAKNQLASARQELRTKLSEWIEAPKDAKPAIKDEIAAIRQNISNIKSDMKTIQNFDNYTNNKVIGLAKQNFELNHPTKLGQSWALTKPTIGLSSNPTVVTTEAISNATTPDSSLASISSEEASSANIQYQQQLEAQKQALQQQYQVLTQQAQTQTTTTSTGGSANIPQQGYSGNILQNWTNQYRV